jgi:hypothetical protein
MMELYLHSPICLCGIVLNYIMKFRDNFTSAVRSVTIEKLRVAQLFRKFPSFWGTKGAPRGSTLSEMYLVHTLGLN